MKLLCESCEVVSEIAANNREKARCPNCKKKGTVFFLEPGQTAKNDAVLMGG